jgi:hypothetical protein
MPANYASIEMRAEATALVLEVEHVDVAVPMAVVRITWDEVPTLVAMLMEQWKAHQHRLAAAKDA